MLNRIPLTDDQVKAKYLFYMITESALIDDSGLPAELRKAATMYECLYSMLSHTLSEVLPMDSVKYGRVLDNMDMICRLMIRCGILFADLNFDAYPQLKELIDYTVYQPSAP